MIRVAKLLRGYFATRTVRRTRMLPPDQAPISPLYLQRALQMIE
jgi:hypothetical protein